MKTSLDAAKQEVKKVSKEHDLLRAEQLQASKDGCLSSSVSSLKSRKVTRQLQPKTVVQESSGCREC